MPGRKVHSEWEEWICLGPLQVLAFLREQDKLGPESRRARLCLSWGARLGTLCARLITFDCQRHVGDSQDWLGRPAELRKLGPDPLGLA